MEATSFLDLPEGCVSAILTFTSPQDVCRSAATASIFRSGANSDSVWENFLPSDYRQILITAVPAVQFSSKKELYFRLCDSILIDGGTKSFSLDKPSGKKCYMVSARQLSITWADTYMYWTWTPLPESRFAEVANLRLVWWLDISGCIDASVLSPKTTYVAYLVVRFNENWHGLARGPTYASVQLGEHEQINIALLCPNNTTTKWCAKDVQVRAAHDRIDGWMEIELGEFYNDVGDEGKLSMRAHNHNCSYTKGGLILEGMEVRPKN